LLRGIFNELQETIDSLSEEQDDQAYLDDEEQDDQAYLDQLANDPEFANFQAQFAAVMKDSPFGTGDFGNPDA